jgi:hypothetical protein
MFKNEQTEKGKLVFKVDAACPSETQGHRAIASSPRSAKRFTAGFPLLSLADASA